MAKYGVPGFQSTGAVTAVMLADMGYTGDTTVLDDPERGFAYFTGYKSWYPAEITEKLGEDWIFPIKLHYKPYPCCGAFHCVLDCLYDIIEPNKIMPEEIESVTTYSRGAMPASKEIHSISGAQFNMPYNMGVLAHRVRRGVEWVDPDTLNNPAILGFIDKVTVKPHPNYLKELEIDPLSNLAKVELVARGKTIEVERKYRRGTVGGTEALPSDDQFLGKFKHNAERILTKNKIERAAQILINLEKLDSVSELMRQVTV
jgi:2-methylcitrate dehydratase PrpD